MNRPFDDQSQIRVRLESEAVLEIIQKTADGVWTMLSSEALHYELRQIPDPVRRARTFKLLPSTEEFTAIAAEHKSRATALRATYGLRALDALHLACAESLQAEVFLTTDDRLLRACQRMPVGELPFRVANPLAWLTEQHPQE